jgi:probable rRNA maturation factor
MAEPNIRKKAQAVLDALGKPDAELSIVIVNDRQITEMNRQYLNRPGPTNVIAFPMQEGEYSQFAQDLLGDVVISAETALRESETAAIDFQMRFDQLLVHGILHLCGYDHVTHAEDAHKMEAKSAELMAKIADA